MILGFGRGRDEYEAPVVRTFQVMFSDDISIEDLARLMHGMSMHELRESYEPIYTECEKNIHFK